MKRVEIKSELGYQGESVWGRSRIKYCRECESTQSSYGEHSDRALVTRSLVQLS